LTQYQKASMDETNSDGTQTPDDLRLTHQSSAVADSLRAWKLKSEKREKAAKKYLDEVTKGISDAQTRISNIGNELVSAQRAAVDQKNIVKSGIPIASIVGLDIPVLTMDAYLRAEKTVAQRKPTCQMPWWALAGIGRAESNHGRFGGAVLDGSGTATPAIIGVALNGNGFRAIGDSDQGRFDNDTVWDHAVGVMQFIPGTWNRWGEDGNGDGVIDPQNVYDAALAAAKYLCNAARPDMSTPEGRRRAFLAYNNSAAYADFVEAKGEFYATVGAGRFNPPLADAPVQ
jgi:membrane-bound lytic murein transglycosylase B